MKRKTWKRRRFAFSLAVFLSGCCLLAFVVPAPRGAASGEEGSKAGYVGAGKCRKCHFRIYKNYFADNKMGKALESLKKDEYTKKDDIGGSGKPCIACHVTGYGEPGGFHLPEAGGDLETALKTFGNVGCEACHGPGGAHVAIGRKELLARAEESKDLEIHRRKPNACVECHNPHVSHKRGKEVKGTWTKDRGPSTASFDGASYIGVDECKACHEKEYETWSHTKHAASFSVLKTDEYDKIDDALDPKMHLKKPPKSRKCIECHVTAYGTGGFKSIDDPASKKFLNVQCEACHGPGSLHKKMAEEYKAAGKELKGVKDQKVNRVPQNVCRNCHHPHILHKVKYPGRRPE